MTGIRMSFIKIVTDQITQRKCTNEKKRKKKKNTLSQSLFACYTVFCLVQMIWVLIQAVHGNTIASISKFLQPIYKSVFPGVF